VKRAKQGAAGFTTIELLIVVAILGMAAAMSVGLFRRGEQFTPATRTVLSMVHEARHAAIQKHRTTRLRITPQPNGRALLTSEIMNVDPTNANKWIQGGGQMVMPDATELCDLADMNATSFGTQAGATRCTAPSTACPMVIESSICFDQNGNVSRTQDPLNCPVGATGSVIFMRTQQAPGAGSGGKCAKVGIWGVTGLPRLLDRW
jgi:prepilin-type N-terminal cleavage/methylation domain-containing protein